MHERKKVNVLYLGGWQRSGSTILGNVLNELDGFFHAGEICYIWTHRPWDIYKCGCGEPVSTCPVWLNVLEHAFGSLEAIDTFFPVRPTSKEVFWKLLLGDSGTAGEKLSEYVNVLERLYVSIQEVTHCRVIVDSSKFPAHAYLLSKIPRLNLDILHLVRDPRGTAYSWQKKIKRVDLHAREMEFPRFGLANSSLKWLLWNIETELLGNKKGVRYLRLRYEDFVAEPAARLDEIIHFSDEHVDSRDFLTGNTVTLGNNHVMVGNPVRGNKGAVELKADAEWKKEMPLKDRLAVLLLTWPLMMRYRYFSFF